MAEPGPGAPKRLFIETYGCQMNVYDSERIRDVMAPHGYDAAERPEDADLIVLNTCHIREKATEKVFSEIGRLRDKRAETAVRGEMKIVVAGCVAQAEGEEILRRSSAVDLVVGPQAYHDLPSLLASGARVADEFAAAAKFRALPKRRAEGVSAFLSVQEGCDKFCTFCVVPYTRGGEFSRPMADVLDEARALEAQGVRELVLLGQNVNAYHGAGGDFATLLSELAKLEGIARLRFTTSHPRDMNDDLIALFAEESKLMPYLHLPFQSGSNRILKAMNRKHRVADYLKIIARLRDTRPDLALSTDIIVGFPGETEQDFRDTLALVREVEFASAYSFKYSPRPGTPAAGMADQVSEDVKTDRLARLLEVLSSQQTGFNRSAIGKTLPVLVERKGRNAGQMHGRSPYLQSVHFEAPPHVVGEIVDVRISGASQNALSGKLEAMVAA